MATDLNLQDLAKAITDGIAATVPQKDVSYSDYVKRPGKRQPKLARPVFQNGQAINIKGASQDTVKHLDGLEPGEYLDGLVKVSTKGRDNNVEVHITYPCATVDDRMAIYSRVSSFSDMVQKIAAEQRQGKR
jgi:hypothetical protein